MLLATQLNEMDSGELFGLIKPILFIVPLIIVIILSVFIYKKVTKLSPKRMFAYMNTQGLSETDKREYLTKYLTKRTNSDLKKGRANCPVCGAKYQIKTRAYNERGDEIEKWNYDGCPYCHTKGDATQVENYRYLSIKRTPTNTPQESMYQENFEKLKKLIEFYKPYIDQTPDVSDDKISVEITFR